MIAYAEHEFTLSRPTSDGATEGDHRASAARQWARLGRKIAEAEPSPEMPEPLRYLWAWFAEILTGCPSNGWVPPQIGWADLRAWIDMSGNDLEPWECAALMRLSEAFVRIRSAKKPEK